MTARPESRQPIPPHARKVFCGVLFDVYQWEQELFDGTTATFERLKRPDTVGVFPVLQDGRILIAREQQPGAAETVSILGGRVEPGEAPEAAALRELREESGYEAASLELWQAQQPVNKIDWAVYTFIARGLTEAGTPSLDAGEKITLMPVRLDELIELVVSGKCAVPEVAQEFVEAHYDPQKRAALAARFAVV